MLRITPAGVLAWSVQMELACPLLVSLGKVQSSEETQAVPGFSDIATR